MYNTLNVPGGKDVKIWTPIHEVESTALDQLKNIARLPWVFSHVAVMPDVHYGKGATVGSVIAMKDAVAPSAVGVDIGCGMIAVRTTMTASDLPDNLEAIRSEIETWIPVGPTSHEGPQWSGGRTSGVKKASKLLFGKFGALADSVQDLYGRASCQLGTLGGGNHFIEICLDEGEIAGDGLTEPRVWLMLHSGSRNIGKTLAEHHISIARGLAHNAELPDKDLAVFLAKTPEMEAYRHDLMWAQDYAMLNRFLMMELLQNALHASKKLPKFDTDGPIACHHNYVSEEMHFGEELLVTRKGAINARQGQMGIIPGSMGTRSYIVEGLGNADSFHSASHGAGRRMSRGAAKRQFTLEDVASQTAGVCCRKDSGIIDELPGAYKSIDSVMENQRDLVEVKACLKAVLCVKG